MLKEDVLAKVDPEQFYREYFEGWKPGKNVTCAKADENHGEGDQTPSMSLSGKNGKAFCHGCGFWATTPVGVVEAMEGISFEEACRRVYDLAVERLVPEGVLKAAREKLAGYDYALARLESARGITRKTVDRYGIGWDGRLVIPIRNDLGYAVDARRYDLLGKFEVKILSYKEGYGGARIWPLDQLKGKEVYFFEGEMDTLLAIDQGLPAVTLTSGAMTWRPEWNKLFKGKDVVMVPDVDKPKKRPDGTTFSPGIDGARKRAAEIAKVAATVRTVLLPLSGEKDEKDFTDWVLKKGGSGATLRELAAKQAPKHGGRVVKGLDAEVDETAETVDETTDPLSSFREFSKTEELYMRRAEETFAELLSKGAFFRNEQAEMFYVPKGGRSIRVVHKGEGLQAHLAKMHPLLNGSTSAGKFVIQHILNHANEASRSSHSGAWSLFHEDSLYLHAGNDKILRARDGELTVLENAVNKDKILLESPPMSKEFVPEAKADIGRAVDLFWRHVVQNLAISEQDQYLTACWLLGIFFRNYIKPKPIIRLLAKTASGKSTASRVLSNFVYGDEMLQHSATTVAATYAMSQSSPFLLFDNIETRNMTQGFEDFLLVASTGGMKAKRQDGTDSGVVLEQTGCLILTNGIEPFVRHELIDRNIELELNSYKFGQSNFNESQVTAEIRRHRGTMLSGLLKMLSKYVVPRVKRGEIQRIGREFGPHSKERFNEYLALMSIILDALWSFRPNKTHGIPHQVVAEWLDEQTVSSQRQDEGTNEVLYFLSTFAERRDRLMDCSIMVKKEDGKIRLRGTTMELLSDFRIMSKHLGIKCPWSSARQLGTRLADSENVLRKAGWDRVQKVNAGRRLYEYVCKVQKN